MAYRTLPAFISCITSASAKNAPRVSLVIPSTREHISGVLRSAIEAQTRAPVETLWVFDADRRGVAWARNRGIEHATGEVIAFLDDDCIPPGDWLARLMATAQRFEADVVGGTYDETDALLADRRGRQGYPHEDVLDDRGLVGAGGNVAYGREILDACRRADGFVFDESLRISQDRELVIRCRRLGAVFAFSAVRVKHLKRLRRIAYLRQQFGRGRGIAALHLRLRADPSLRAPHRSLLWSGGDPGRRAGPQWRAIFWHKICGPFDLSSFRSKRDFATFWLGEKVQGLGFVWEMLHSVSSFGRNANSTIL